MFRNIYIFLALTISSYISAFAQAPENPGQPKDSAAVIREYQLDPLTKQTDSIAFDTTMQEFHIYNPIYKNNFSNSFLGNSGQAYQSNDFSVRNIYSPFIFEKPFLAYFHDPFNISHYNTRKPFTQIEYISFGKSDNSEQVIKALHTQNLNPNTNFGFLYDLIASKGIYLYQSTKANRFTFFGSYDKNAYSVYGSFNINKITQVENGGLIDIIQFEKHESKEPKNYRMFFDIKDSIPESIVRKNVFYISQTLDIQKGVKDTSAIKKKEETLFHLNHTLSYSKFYKLYRDIIPLGDTLNFYSDNYYMVNMAGDSASSQILENSFQISGDSYKFLPGFIVGIKHQYQEYGNKFPLQTQVKIDSVIMDTIVASHRSTSYNNLSVYASILDKSNKRIHYGAFAEYFFAGYRLNDLKADFNLKYFSKNQKSFLTASANFYLTEPDFFLKNYSSSHFRWNNNFLKISNTGANITFSLNNSSFLANAGINLIGNYVFFDQRALPAVSDKNILVSSLRLEKRFKWKGFNQVNRFLVQKSSNEEVLHLPLFAYGNISYYEKSLFKKALTIQVGFDLYYNTSYYADAFMPATGIFYRQDKREVGNYPFVDAFLNWKIKSVRLFIKYTNTLTGLAGYNYFTTYGYPMNDRGLRFGFSWTFYD